MAMTAEKLKDKATSSGAAAIETKLNDATRLHNFLLEEVENHSDVLKDKIEKWETLHTRIQDLTSWVDATEEKLEMLKRNENLDGHSLTSIKVWEFLSHVILPHVTM
jgi:chromosome segregation ATPase